MLRIETDIPQTNPAAGAAIYGLFRNDTSGSAVDGTPLLESYVNDLYYQMYNVLTDASIIPNSQNGKDGDTQLLDAIKQVVINANATPLGSIVLWPVDGLPSANHLYARGGTVLIADYPDLFNVYGTTYGGDGATTFGLPDYRGRAVRGTDAGAGRDSNAVSRGNRGDGVTGDAVGTVQGDSTRRPNSNFLTNIQGNHTHLYQDTWHSENQNLFNIFVGGAGGSFTQSVPANSGSMAFDVADINRGWLRNKTSSANGNHSHTITGGGDAETRMKNINADFIILARV